MKPIQQEAHYFVEALLKESKAEYQKVIKQIYQSIQW